MAYPSQKTTVHSFIAFQNKSKPFTLFSRKKDKNNRTDNPRRLRNFWYFEEKLNLAALAIDVGDGFGAQPEKEAQGKSDRQSLMIDWGAF
jgi:hypothetical protein